MEAAKTSPNQKDKLIQTTYLYKYTEDIEKVFLEYTSVKIFTTIGLRTTLYKVPGVKGTNLRTVGNEYLMEVKEGFNLKYKVKVISLHEESCYKKLVHRVTEINGKTLKDEYQIDLIFAFFEDTSQHLTYVAHSIAATTKEIAQVFPFSHFCIHYSENFCSGVDNHINKEEKSVLFETGTIFRPLEAAWDQLKNFKEAIKRIYVKERNVEITEKIEEGNILNIHLKENETKEESIFKLLESKYEHNKITLKIEKDSNEFNEFISESNINDSDYNIILFQLELLSLDDVSLFIKLEVTVHFYIDQKMKTFLSSYLHKIIRKIKKYLESNSLL